MLIALIASVAFAGQRPAATSEWVRVDDDALLCTHPGRAGDCVRFREPGAISARGDAPRVFRVVARRGDEVEIQAQHDVGRSLCGVLPSALAPLSLRLFAPAAAVETIGEDPCVDPESRLEPAPGRDPVLQASRVATVAEGTWIRWTDGSIAGRARRDLWLQEDHGLYQEAGRWCVTYALGPDDGGAVAGRSLDLCFDPSGLTLH